MKNVTEHLPEKWRPYSKAIFTLIGSTLGAILLVIDPNQIPDWVQVLAVIFGVTSGGAYAPRNDSAE